MVPPEIWLITMVIWMIFLTGLGSYIGYREVKLPPDYLVARRTVGALRMIPVSISAYIGALTVVGLSGYGYNYGYAGFLATAFGWFMGYFTYWVFASRLRRSGVYTLIDVLRERYYDQKLIPSLASIVVILHMVGALLPQLIGIGVMFQVLANIPPQYSITAIGLGYVIYTLIGGMYSSAWLNAIQGVIIWIGLVILIPFIVAPVGGFSGLYTTLATSPDLNRLLTLTAGGALPAIVIAGLFFSNIAAGIRADMISVILSAKDERSARIGLAVSLPLGVIAWLTAFHIGLVERVLRPGVANPNLIVAYAIQGVPDVLAILFAIIAISLMVTTVDTLLIAISGAISNNILRVIKPNISDRGVMIASRMATGVVGILTILAALILWTTPVVIPAAQLYAIATVTLFPLTYLGLAIQRLTREGAIAALIVGLIVTISWMIARPLPYTGFEVIAGLIASLITFFAVSLITPKPPEHVIKRFFGPIAEEVKAK